jgi:hypothetical protein
MKGFYLESGYRGRSKYTLSTQNCDSMLSFLSPQMYQNFSKVCIAINTIKRFPMLYNLDIKQIDLNLTYIQKKLSQRLLLKNKSNLMLVLD